MRLRPVLITGASVLAFVLPASAQASSRHWCRQGQPPILASQTTSCAFAGRALDAYYQSARGRDRFSARVYSPTTHKSYALSYQRNGGPASGDVTATGPRGIWLRFNWSRFG